MAGLSLKDRWVLSFFSWLYRSRGAPFNLSEIRNRPVRLLVCLPSDPEEARIASGIVPELVASLGAESVYVVGEPGYAARRDLADDLISVLPLDRIAQRWSGLPTTRVVDRLSEAGINFAVDLNPCAELLPSVLCLRINAPVRLCLHDPLREHFFNIRILLADGGSPLGRDTGPAKPPPAEPASSTGESSDPPPGGAEASSGGLLYIRLLRVVQSAVGTTDRPRVSS